MTAESLLILSGPSLALEYLPNLLSSLSALPHPREAREGCIFYPSMRAFWAQPYRTIVGGGPRLCSWLGDGAGILIHDSTQQSANHPPISITNSVFQPLRRGAMRTSSTAYTTSLAPRSNSPPPTASIVADANHSNRAHESEYWSTRGLPSALSHRASPIEDQQQNAVTIAPKMATGEREAEVHPETRIQVEWPAGRAAGRSQHIALGQAIEQVEFSVDLLITSLFSIFRHIVNSFLC